MELSHVMQCKLKNLNVCINHCSLHDIKTKALSLLKLLELLNKINSLSACNFLSMKKHD